MWLFTGSLTPFQVQHAALLAQRGDYQRARMRLISNQRLLQRGMKSKEVQASYVRYIQQAERLDGFMREAAAMEKVFGKADDKSRAAQRDDVAARNIVQMKNAPRALFEPLAA